MFITNTEILFGVFVIAVVVVVKNVLFCAAATDSMTPF